MKKSNLVKHLSLAASAGMLLTACSSMRDQDSNYRHSSSGMSGQSTRYSSMDESSIATESSGAQSYSSSQDRDQISIPLHEERLNVGKQTVDAGQVTIRKIVTTETVNQPVQLRRESLIIDREGSGSQRSASTSSRQNTSDWKPGAQNQSAGVSASANVGSASAGISADASADEPAGAYAESAASQQRATSSGTSGNAFQEETFTIRLQEEQPVIQKNVIETGRVTARKDSQTQQQNIQQQVRREDVQLDRSAARNVQIRGNFNTAGSDISEPSGAERQQSIQQDSSDAPVQGVYENDATEGNDRVPTQGLGAQDLKGEDQLQQNQSQPESQP